MKKVVIMILACLLMLSLCACDQGAQGGADNSQAQTGQQNDQTQSSDATGESEQASSQATQESTQASQIDRKALAESCIEKPLADLIALIGEPDSSEYASSCAGEGEDGVLMYDGFVVYTYREGEEEKVTYVE